MALSNKAVKFVGDTLIVDVSILNLAGSSQTFLVGLSIGRYPQGPFHDRFAYNDNKGDYGSISLGGGATGNVRRSLKIPADSSITGNWDLWVTVRNPNNLDEVYAEDVSYGVLQFAVVDAQIVSIQIS